MHACTVFYAGNPIARFSNRDEILVIVTALIIITIVICTAFACACCFVKREKVRKMSAVSYFKSAVNIPIYEEVLPNQLNYHRKEDPDPKLTENMAYACGPQFVSCHTSTKQ